MGELVWCFNIVYITSICFPSVFTWSFLISICMCLCVFSSGQQTRLEEDASESRKHNKHTHNASAMTVASTALSSSAQAQKKQVKRRHRRKRSSCTTFDCVEANGKQEQRERGVSSDRSELGEKRERSFRNRKELPPRLRCSGAAQSDSSSEEEANRGTRSWSKEKARRARRRSVSSRERDAANCHKGGEDKAEVMELQSVDSDEGKENQPLVEDSGGLKKRHNIRGSLKRDGQVSERERSRSRENEKQSYKSRSTRGSSSLAEDGEELITKRYQEKGSGGGDMSVPTPQKHCGVNGSSLRHCSDDSELEVCRLVCKHWSCRETTFNCIMPTCKKAKTQITWNSLDKLNQRRNNISFSVQHTSYFYVQDLPLWGGWRISIDNTMSLHGKPELRPSGLSQPVDQIVGHSLLWTLQIWFHHGDEAQTFKQGRHTLMIYKYKVRNFSVHLST